MRYTITSTQIEYFRKEGHIEFQPFLKTEESKILKNLLDEAKIKTPSGRDLERENKPLGKALQLSRLGQIASQLFNKKRVVLGLTQYFPKFHKVCSLDDLSTVTETVGCALLNLSNEPLPGLSYLPIEQGDIGFYSNRFPIDFTSLELPVLFIVFTEENVRYKFQQNDPETHFLKKLGYAFGDRLMQNTHPLIHS